MGIPLKSRGSARFDEFEVDLRTLELRTHRGKIKLQEQPSQVLALLLERPGEVVTREELISRLWPAGTFVDFDHSLNKAVNRLREALSDSPESPRFIETLPRKGYRFIAQVHRTAGEAGAAEAQPTPVDDNEVSPPAVGPVKKWRREVLAWVLFGVVSVTLVVLAEVYFQVLHPASQPTLKTFPLTSYPGWQREPAFSPDGKQVAFCWDGDKGNNFDIYVKLVGAELPLRLTTSPEEERFPVWSPDGSSIAFYRVLGKGHHGGIFTVPALGGVQRMVAQTASISLGLSWSPDGKSLAIVDETSPKGVSAIFSLAMASGEKRKITSPPDGYMGDSFPMFSPDGEAVAFIRTVNYSSIGDLYVLPLVQGAPNGEPRRVTFDGHRIYGLDWTEDGRNLAFSSNRSGGSSLWMVSAAGGMLRRLAVTGENAKALSIARTGHRLAYERGVAPFSIWRVPGPNSADKRSPPLKFISSKQTDLSPKYSPDGKSILFQSTRSGDLEIWICDSEGRNPVQLTSFGGAQLGSPRWSPDSQSIAFDSTKEGNADIYVISVEAGRVRRVTTEAFNEVRPSWSRDGRWIYFGSDRTGDWQIWKVPVQGGTAVQVTKRGGRDSIESADGKFVYYAKTLEIAGIWRVPISGGDETQVLDQGWAGGWALTDQGICFRGTREDDNFVGPAIKFYSFENRHVTTLRQFSKDVTILNSINNPLSISSDGHWILYTQMDQSGSDLMLVENFR